MAEIENPDLSLKNLNELEGKVVSNIATPNDYETLDFFISAIGGNKDYIKSTLNKNGIRNLSEYISQRTENRDGNKVILGSIYGTIRGAIDFLKTYAIQNKFYL